MPTITASQIFDAAKQYPISQLAAEIKSVIDCADDDENIRNIDYILLSELYANPDRKAPQAFKALGLWREPGNDGDVAVIHYDFDKLAEAYVLAERVMDEYENPIVDEDTGRVTGGVWDTLELSGDDDVDYAGSHVMVTIDIIRAYEALTA